MAIVTHGRGNLRAGPPAVTSLAGDGAVDIMSADHISYQFTVFFQEASEVSAPAYLSRICTELDYFIVSMPTGAEYGQTRWARYLLPVDGGDDFSVYDSPHLFSTHGEFLAATFPGRFGGLTEEEYDRQVGRRATRRYFGGRITRLRSRTSFAFGFDVLVSAPSDPAERLTVDEVRADAAGWADPGFPILTTLFRRGDVTSDGSLNIADAVAILEYLFGPGTTVLCMDAADTNDDGQVDISDTVTRLRHLFFEGFFIPDANAGCTWDPTPDSLSCEQSPPCS